MKVQDIFTAAKLFALISIILAGVYSMSTGKSPIVQRTQIAHEWLSFFSSLLLPFDAIAGDLDNFDNAWEGKYDAGSMGFAFYSGLFAFGGWNYLNFVTGELIDPYK